VHLYRKFMIYSLAAITLGALGHAATVSVAHDPAILASNPARPLISILVLLDSNVVKFMWALIAVCIVATIVKLCRHVFRSDPITPEDLQGTGRGPFF
jgi:hypothetical protein